MAHTAVIGGVDTHKHTHYAAAIDDNGRLLGDQEFRADHDGYAALPAWLCSHGTVVAVGVESTGNFGAALTRFLTAAGQMVVEVNTPNRHARHMEGKSDRLDAEQIARSVLAGTGTAIPAIPKSKSGPVEAIRILRDGPGQRGASPHPGVQHHAPHRDQRPLAGARPTGPSHQTPPGQPLFDARSGH
jgi:hypothetical protein